MKKQWRDFLWVVSALYLILGVFNIMFAWIGLACFFIPLMVSFAGGGKAYCNTYCGRGQLLDLLGSRLKLSRNRPIPGFIRSKWFRYGFLVFFLAMFSNMLFTTYLVLTGEKTLAQMVTLLWTFKLPWHWALQTSSVPMWAAQFAFGFYSVMLTSSFLGIVTMVLFKPRSWCVYCPMGTMTQLVSKARYKLVIKENNNDIKI